LSALQKGNKMTVKELIKKLSELNPETKVLILGQGIKEGVVSDATDIKKVLHYYSDIYCDDKEAIEMCAAENLSLNDVVIY
jgi:hypothetical protein